MESPNAPLTDGQPRMPDGGHERSKLCSLVAVANW